ncbi:ABC transporter ATP-binding protein [Luteococcus sp. OSA5]|uniref:ABC transporter ATP-binding protein n=1 Tax=Luteococcus sp. OSA5 TaxID=3401630 RepID=UPI003B42F5CD
MLEVRNLTRRYGENVAADDVTFRVADGHMIGFVGGNGAGKTTTMRMIMGLLAPDAGQVLWNGAEATFTDRSHFGYMPEERGLYPKQPILDQLVYLARLKGMSATAARAEAQELLERFGLGERTKDKLEKLSLGNQQRVQIAAAVMANPTCLILDEPFSGLDPTAIDQMADLLRERASQGIPVLFSSHQLDLIDRLCDGLVILARGRVVAQGNREELEQRGRVRHRLVASVDTGWVRDLPGVHAVDVDGCSALLEFAEPGCERRVLTEALQRGEVLELSRVRPTLSEIYREVAA